MQKTYLALWVVQVAFMLPAPALAQDLTGTLQKIKESGSITIGYRETSMPFSYIDDDQKPIGFALDICYKIVDEVKATLKLDKLEVRLTPVSSATRIPLIGNGTIDLECASTTNNLEREQLVAFSPSYFLTANRFVSKTSSGLKTIDDLKGQDRRLDFRHVEHQGVVRGEYVAAPRHDDFDIQGYGGRLSIGRDRSCRRLCHG